MTPDHGGLLRVLSQSRVDFIIVGGVAANLHGALRTTLDLDVVHSPSWKRCWRNETDDGGSSDLIRVPLEAVAELSGRLLDGDQPVQARVVRFVDRRSPSRTAWDLASGRGAADQRQAVGHGQEPPS